MTVAEPEITVVIPTKGRVPFLLRAIASASRQVGPSAEILVVDDGEGEGAAAAAALALPRLRTARTGGAGQVAARNLGVSIARGTAIAFLDDDDWWAVDDHLQRLASALPASGLAFASGLILRETEAMEPVETLPFHAGADAASLRRDNTLLVSGIAYARAIHSRIGPFDAGLPCYWDWDFYLRLVGSGGALRDGGGDGVRISVRVGTVSAGTNEALRRADLARLCAKHGLTGITLKNHDSLAEEQRGAVSPAL
jgi:glycosyltransferase involved in cell wall biosynthesis